MRIDDASEPIHPSHLAENSHNCVVNWFRPIEGLVCNILGHNVGFSHVQNPRVPDPLTAPNKLQDYESNFFVLTVRDNPSQLEGLAVYKKIQDGFRFQMTDL